MAKLTIWPETFKNDKLLAKYIFTFFTFFIFFVFLVMLWATHFNLVLYLFLCALCGKPRFNIPTFPNCRLVVISCRQLSFSCRSVVIQLLLVVHYLQLFTTICVATTTIYHYLRSNDHYLCSNDHYLPQCTTIYHYRPLFTTIYNYLVRNIRHCDQISIQNLFRP